MSDTFRETTSRSWFSRIGSSFTGALIGILLIVAAVIGLFWNEGRAVTTARSLAEGASAVASVPADAVDAAHDGKLIHVSGPLAADTQPEDDEFGITAPGVRLQRRVEMYQWTETSKSETQTKLGGGEETVTTYSYSKGWEDEAVDAGEFRQPGGHENPPMDVRDASFQVPQANLGAFQLGKEALDALGDTETLPVKRDQLAAVQAAYGGTRPVSLADGRIYLGDNAGSPRVGDYRIGYSLVPLKPVSIVARQNGDTLEGYQTQAGDRLLLTAAGDVPADRMFSDAVSANTFLTWIIRLVGLLVLWVAFALVMGPLGVLADVVPLFGSIVRFGTGLIALALTVFVGGTVIAVAWMFYRPLLALGIIAVAIVASVLLLRLRRKAPQATAAPKPAA